MARHSVGVIISIQTTLTPIERSIYRPASRVTFADHSFASHTRVLDVGCGTGAFVRAVLRCQPLAQIIGIDRAAPLLQRARAQTPDAHWLTADARALPFPAMAFDHVISQAMLQHVTERAVVIEQMARVLRPGGQLTLTVWGALNDCPAFAEYFHIIEPLYGAPDSWAPGPFCFDDLDALHGLVESAGLKDVRSTRLIAQMQHRSVEEFLTFGGADLSPDPAVLHRLAARLARFCDKSGALASPIPIHRVIAYR